MESYWGVLWVLCQTATLHVFEDSAGSRPRKQKNRPKRPRLQKHQRKLGQIDEKNARNPKKALPGHENKARIEFSKFWVKIRKIAQRARNIPLKKIHVLANICKHRQHGQNIGEKTLSQHACTPHRVPERSFVRRTVAKVSGRVVLKIRALRLRHDERVPCNRRGDRVLASGPHNHRGILGWSHIGVAYVHVTAGFVCRFSPMFAEFCRFLQKMQKHGVIFPGSLGDFSHFDPKS